MDIYCKRCGEPWDAWGARHSDMTPEEYQRMMAGKGCPCCYGMTACDKTVDCLDCPEYVGHRCRANKSQALANRPLRAEAMAVVHEVLGDDIDGIAATLDDLGLT